VRVIGKSLGEPASDSSGVFDMSALAGGYHDHSFRIAWNLPVQGDTCQYTKILINYDHEFGKQDGMNNNTFRVRQRYQRYG
jgi:hypothetical protein